MANIYSFQIRLDIPCNYLVDVAECLLHSVFFHRQLKEAYEEEACIKSLKFPYSRLAETDEHSKKVYRNIKYVLENISNPEADVGNFVQFKILFQEAKSGFIFTTKEIWEQWTITLNVTPKLVCPSDTTSILTQKLFDIITNAQTNSEAQYVQFADRFSSVVEFARTRNTQALLTH